MLCLITIFVCLHVRCVQLERIIPNCTLQGVRCCCGRRSCCPALRFCRGLEGEAKRVDGCSSSCCSPAPSTTEAGHAAVCRTHGPGNSRPTCHYHALVKHETSILDNFGRKFMQKCHSDVFSSLLFRISQECDNARKENFSGSWPRLAFEGYTPFSILLWPKFTILLN